MPQESSNQTLMSIVSAFSGTLGTAGSFLAGFFTDVDLATARGDLGRIAEIAARGSDETAAEIREALHISPIQGDDSSLNPQLDIIEAEG